MQPPRRPSPQACSRLTIPPLWREGRAGSFPPGPLGPWASKRPGPTRWAPESRRDPFPLPGWLRTLRHPPQSRTGQGPWPRCFFRTRAQTELRLRGTPRSLLSAPGPSTCLSCFTPAREPSWQPDGGRSPSAGLTAGGSSFPVSWPFTPWNHWSLREKTASNAAAGGHAPENEGWHHCPVQMQPLPGKCLGGRVAPKEAAGHAQSPHPHPHPHPWEPHCLRDPLSSTTPTPGLFIWGGSDIPAIGGQEGTKP